MRRSCIAFALGITAAPALANVPVSDAAQLTQRSETAGTTVKLVPLATQRKDASKGVNCAVTTGTKASVKDPTVQPQSGAGAKTIHSYAPNLPVTPDPSARGASLNSQTLFQAAGTVTGGIDASRSTLGAAQAGFSSAGQLVGTGQTVMAAFDMNSAARLENTLAWNSAIGSANLWVTALNALNLARNSDVSRAAGGMAAILSSGQTGSGATCPIGTVGSGTAADPCRKPSTCQTTAPGAAPDPACASARYVDTEEGVLFYLQQIQNAATAAGR